MEAARLASLADGAQVAAMRRALADYLRPLRGGANLMTERAGAQVDWATWLDDPERHALVGTLDGHAVGYALIRRELRGAAATGVVEELWVEPAARGVGVGEAMMAAVVAWCRGCGCEGIDAAALPGDRAMKGFFETHGLTARLLVMHRRLDPKPVTEKR